jgi:catechol 2,3-dioxygenase-like lactoylglutathione lyase family enzyme
MIKGSRPILLAAAVAAAASMSLRAPAQSQPPPVFLNHFYVVIDSASYAAMQTDKYLTTTFAPFEKRTTVRNDETYTGVYWYGRHTYFEVFEPPSQGPQGSSGIALSVDGEGESAAIKALWSASLGETMAAPVTRRTETGEPLWFQMTAGPQSSGALRMWLMEYDREFLSRWYASLTPARGKTRAEVLDRYVAKIGKSGERETAVFGDVTRLVVALDDNDRALLTKHVVPAGWAAKEGGSARHAAFRGPNGVTIEVVPASGNQRGIIEAEFSVQGEPKPHSSRLGSVWLTVERTLARLRFVP